MRARNHSRMSCLPALCLLLAACVASPTDPAARTSAPAPAAAASATAASSRIAPVLYAAARALREGADPAQYARGVVRADAQGRLQVYVQVDNVTPSLVTALEQAGLQQAEAVPAMRIVQGWVAPDRMEALALVPGVAGIVPPRNARTR